MQSSRDQEQAELVLKINTFVQAQQDAYIGLSFDAQRQRGPCTLDYLLHRVLDYLAEDADDHDGHALHAATTSIPFAVRDVPALARVAALQMRLTSTVLSAISTHPILTLFDLEAWVCAMEGVGHFVELGIGVGLQVLPIVQQYFQLRANSIVFPVRTSDILTFLMNNPDAREVLLYGGGDARDLLNRFSHFYDQTVLDAVSTNAEKEFSDASSAAAPVSLLPEAFVRSGVPCGRSSRQRVQNVRQLGVHIQDYASFLAYLAQSVADNDEEVRQLAAMSRKVASSRVYRCERNRPLYERVVQAFDSACAERQLIEEMRRKREQTALAATSNEAQHGSGDNSRKTRDFAYDNKLSDSSLSSASARCSDFVVSCSESEARRYDVPLTMWRSSNIDITSSAGQLKGGVELHFHVGEDAAVRRQHDQPQSREFTKININALDEAQAGQVEAQQIASSPVSSILTSSSTAAPAVRRRRGAVVSDVSVACAAVEEPLTGAPSSTSVTAPAFQLTASALPSLTGSTFLSNLFKPAGSLGLAGTVADSAVLNLETDVKDITETTKSDEEVQTPAASPADEPTPLEQLYVFTTAEEQNGNASETTQLPATEDTTVEKIGKTIELLAQLRAGDVVPVQLICDAWTGIQRVYTKLFGSTSALFSTASMEGGALSSCTEEWRHRHFIPLFASSTIKQSNASLSSPISRLAALRQQLSGGGGNGPSRGADPSCPNAPAPSSNAASTSSTEFSEVKEVLYMASPAEVCWSTWLPSKPSIGAAVLDVACLAVHYPTSCRTVFCDVLRVCQFPTVAAWCTAAQCVRRVYSPAMLTVEFTQRYLESFAKCVEAEIEARMIELRGKDCVAGAKQCADTRSVEKRSIAQERRAAELALQAVVDSVHDALSGSPLHAGLFPCDHAWRCGLDGLLYVTPRLCGYNGVVLQPVKPSTTRKSALINVPPLHVLCFTSAEPSWGVCAVLRYFGIRPLEALVETRVSFSSTIDTQASGILHDKIAAIVPYLQGFCRSRLAPWYAMAYADLQRRLRHLKVVLTAAGAAGSAPQQLLRLHWQGHLYTHQREIRLEYVAAHNIIFGTAEDYAVPMLADALLPLLCPLALKSEEDRASLRAVVAALLGAVSSLQSSYENLDVAEAQRQLQAQAEEVLGRVAAEHHFEPFRHQEAHEQPLPVQADTAAEGEDPSYRQVASFSKELVETPFVLPARPFVRFQSYFPPGTDAMRQPRGPAGGGSSRDHQHRHGHGQSPSTASVVSSLRKLSRTDAAELASAHRGATHQLIGGAVQQHRFGADGRLRVTLTLPGSGGGTAVATSHPAWVDFPLSVDVRRVVTHCANDLRKERREDVEEEGGSGDDDVADKGDTAEASGEGGSSSQEGFLTFQYHRQAPPPPTAPSSRKRSRNSDDRGDHCSSAWWLLRPPASSSVMGSAGDTPGYAVAAEKFVYEQLCAEYATQMQQHGVRVIWVNEHTEAGSPFDILIIRPRFNASTNGANASFNARGGAGSNNKLVCRQGPESRQTDSWDVVAYIEVKSTCTANRAEFELSLSELLFAARFGATYKVYRVFGASTDRLRRMRCTVYADLVQMWYRAELTITSDIRVTPSK